MKNVPYGIYVALGKHRRKKLEVSTVLGGHPVSNISIISTSVGTNKSATLSLLTIL